MWSLNWESGTVNPSGMWQFLELGYSNWVKSWAWGFRDLDYPIVIENLTGGRGKGILCLLQSPQLTRTPGTRHCCCMTTGNDIESQPSEDKTILAVNLIILQPARTRVGGVCDNSRFACSQWTRRNGSVVNGLLTLEDKLELPCSNGPFRSVSTWKLLVHLLLPPVISP